MRALTHGRTNIRRAKKGNKPNYDKFCYWDAKKKSDPSKDAGIAERLNYTIKPNNTRDYGSQGAMENRIRSRVFNERRTVPLFGKSGGSTCGRTCVKKEYKPGKKWNEQNEDYKTARKNVNRVSKNGESGQLIYWKSKLLVTKQ